MNCLDWRGSENEKKKKKNVELIVELLERKWRVEKNK